MKSVTKSTDDIGEAYAFCKPQALLIGEMEGNAVHLPSVRGVDLRWFTCHREIQIISSVQTGHCFPRIFVSTVHTVRCSTMSMFDDPQGLFELQDVLAQLKQAHQRHS